MKIVHPITKRQTTNGFGFFIATAPDDGSKFVPVHQ